MCMHNSIHSIACSGLHSTQQRPQECNCVSTGFGLALPLAIRSWTYMKRGVATFTSISSCHTTLLSQRYSHHQFKGYSFLSRLYARRGCYLHGQKGQSL